MTWLLLCLPSSVAHAAERAPLPADHAMHAGHMQMASAAAVPMVELTAVTILRRAWINLDLMWAVALIITGALSLAL